MKTIRVVAAIILHEGTVFATQRGYGAFKDGWEFPGGKIEENETPQEALVREIREELDTEIAVRDLFDTVEYDYPGFSPVHEMLHMYGNIRKSGLKGARSGPVAGPGKSGQRGLASGRIWI